MNGENVNPCLLYVDYSALDSFSLATHLASEFGIAGGYYRLEQLIDFYKDKMDKALDEAVFNFCANKILHVCLNEVKRIEGQYQFICQRDGSKLKLAAHKIASLAKAFDYVFVDKAALDQAKLNPKSCFLHYDTSLSSKDIEEIYGLYLNKDALSLGELLKCITEIKDNHPDKKIAVLGELSLAQALKCQLQGAEMLVTASPFSLARQGQMIDGLSLVNMADERYRASTERPVAQCECTICANYNQSYLHHLATSVPMLLTRLLIVHNLTQWQRWQRHLLSEAHKGKLLEFVNTYMMCD